MSNRASLRETFNVVAWPTWKKLRAGIILATILLIALAAVKIQKSRIAYQQTLEFRSEANAEQDRMARLAKLVREGGRSEIDRPVDENIERFLEKIAILRDAGVKFRIQSTKHSVDPVAGGYAYPVRGSQSGLWESDWLMSATLPPSTILVILPVIQSELKINSGVVTEIRTRDIARMGDKKISALEHGSPGTVPVYIRFSIYGTRRTNKSGLETWLSNSKLSQEGIVRSLESNAANNLKMVVPNHR